MYVYIETAPPTILVRVPSGSAAVDHNGGLVVFPGSILHLECLYLRRHGDPEWTWTSEAETYLTGKFLNTFYACSYLKICNLYHLFIFT